MKKIIFTSFLLLLATIGSKAGINDSLENIYTSSFFKFYDFREIKHDSFPDTVKHYRPVLFRDKILLVLNTDSLARLKSAQIQVHRSVINNNSWTLGLIRYFLTDVSTKRSAGAIQPLADHLENQGDDGLIPDLKLAYLTILGSKYDHYFSLENCYYELENLDVDESGQGYLRISIRQASLNEGWNYLSVHDSLFVKDSIITRYGLELVQTGTNMREYLHPNSKALVFRLADIRWQFEDSSQAARFHSSQLIRNAENGEEILKHSLVFPAYVSDLHIFKQNAEMRQMMMSLGVFQKQFYFIFQVDNVVVKVFVAGSRHLNLSRASKFALEAARQFR